MVERQLKVQVVSGDWIHQLDQILPSVDIVINGCDDVAATLRLMRKAKQHNKVVVDAFASTLPNVYVVRPTDPRPEEFMQFPTQGLNAEQWTEDLLRRCSQQEMEYVLTHSSTLRHVVLKFAAEMVQGKRKRISLAPMVWGTGILMSYEALKFLMNQATHVRCYGVFMNPYSLKFERAKPNFWAWLKRQFVRKALERLSRS